MLNKYKPEQNKNQLLEITEKASLIGAVTGTIFAAVSQQVFFTSIPLLSLTLMSQTNRRRLEIEHQSQQNQIVTIINVQQSPRFLEQGLQQLEQNQQNQANTIIAIQKFTHSLEHQIEKLQININQLETNQTNYLTRLHLSPIIVKLRQIQRRLKIESPSQLENLIKQVKELQQQINDLDVSTEALHDSTRNWGQQIERLLPLLKQSERGKYDRVAIFVDGSNLYHTAKELDKFNMSRMKLIGSRNLHFYDPKLIKRVRLIKRADGFYAQFCIDVERNENQASTGNKIGIDVGLNHFYTDSNGNQIDNPRFLRKSLKLLKKRQRQVSKKKKGSNNRHKAINRLARTHLIGI
jgi:transposase